MMLRSPMTSESPWDVLASLPFSFWCFDAKGGEEGLLGLVAGSAKAGHKHMHLPFFESLCPLYCHLCFICV